MTHTMRGTVFYKMSGSGNDFVMLDGRHSSPEVWSAERIRAVCDRRLGVGADGLVIVTPDGRGVVRMDFWNCDGSRADMCGNAALCATGLATFLDLGGGAPLRLATGVGIFPVETRPGPGELAALALPDFRLPQPVPGLSASHGHEVLGLAVVGVPHRVLSAADLASGALMEVGRQLRSDPALGPAGANVNFVSRSGAAGAWCLRTYERGVEGETLACGTGAVAAAASLISLGRAKSPVEVITRSGRSLHITATLSGGHAKQVLLSGEGRLVFTGVL
ncbi:MAG: diaminopimelate epimerase [Gemmatimonadales bacterium]|nr:MAG: diaminopimelate epimerase [Gemmatimonadales bacterium]